MNKALYNKYKHLPLKPGHKWGVVDINEENKDHIHIVTDNFIDKTCSVVVPYDALKYFADKFYRTVEQSFKDWYEEPVKTHRPMTFKEAVKHLWELQQNGPVLIQNWNVGVLFTSLDDASYIACETCYSTDLGNTWSKFEIEVTK